MLTDKDFFLTDGVLCTESPGLSLVMFHTRKCTKEVKQFDETAKRNPWLKFGIINIEGYEELQAAAPYTPYITTYIDGYPWKLQDGDMCSFVENIIQEFVDKALEGDIERVEKSDDLEDEDEDWDIVNIEIVVEV